MSDFQKALPAVITFAIVTGITSVVLDVVQDLGGIAVGVVSLASLGPALGALAVWIFHRATVAELMPAPVARRQFIAHLVLGVVAALVFAGLLFGITEMQIRVLPPAADAPPAWLAIPGLLLGALLQELGWRATLQPLLERGGSRLLACLGVGLLWGFWWVQLLSVEPSVVAIGSVMLASLALSVLLGYFGNGSPLQRAAAATLVHWLVVTALYLIVGPGMLDDSGALAYLIAIGVTAVVFMAMFVAAQRKRAKRRALVEA